MKEYEELNFTDDFMFCKVMTNNPDLCHELLELIIGHRKYCIWLWNVGLTEVKFSKADEILSGDDRFKSYRTWRRL